jgi:hypothetical protein
MGHKNAQETLSSYLDNSAAAVRQTFVRYALDSTRTVHLI